MFGIGPMELVLILVVALLVFGPKRLPELARTLGRGMGEFRRASNDLRQSLALDDLQKDLRDGLAGDPSIHRPAQAGDSFTDTPNPAQAEASGSSPTAAANESAEEPNHANSPHPGELPLDNDHQHNEVHSEPESADSSFAEAGSEAGLQEPAATRPVKPTTEPTMGDSELGNIPVTKPPNRAPKSDSERG